MDTTRPARSAHYPSPKSRRYRRTSVEQRERWVSLYESGGQDLKSFCRQHDLATSTLMLWRRQLRGPGRRKRSRQALVEVPMKPSRLVAPIFRSAGDGTAALIVQLPNGLRLEVAPGTDVRWLSGALGVLRGVLPTE